VVCEKYDDSAFTLLTLTNVMVDFVLQTAGLLQVTKSLLLSDVYRSMRPDDEPPRDDESNS
jgi:hypothetical protein